MSGIGVIIVILVLLIFILAFPIFWIWYQKWQLRTISHEPINLIHEVSGNDFPGKEFTDKLIVLLNKKGFHSLNKNLFLYRTHTDEEAKNRGFYFETRIWKIINEFHKKNKDVFLKSKREVTISSDSRVDFLLEWTISENQWIKAIVECKHSFCYESRKEQMDSGKNQLIRYKERLKEANLLILLTDFRIPDNPRPFRIEKGILVINHNLFPDVMQMINDFVFWKRYSLLNLEN